MTIINTIIAGAGGGDEVEAYALGEAKNAVKGDKVLLNFSADVPTGEDSFKAPLGSIASGAVYDIRGNTILYNRAPSSNHTGYYNFKTGNYTYKFNGKLWFLYNNGLFYYQGVYYQNLGETFVNLFTGGYHQGGMCSDDGKVAFFPSQGSGSTVVAVNWFIKQSNGLFQHVSPSGSYSLHLLAIKANEQNDKYTLFTQTGAYIYDTINNTISLINNYSLPDASGSEADGNCGFVAGRYLYSFPAASNAYFNYIRVWEIIKDEQGLYSLKRLQDLESNVKSELIGLDNVSSQCPRAVCYNRNMDIVMVIMENEKGVLARVNKETGLMSAIVPYPSYEKGFFSDSGVFVAKTESTATEGTYVVSSLEGPIEQPYVATEPLQNQIHPVQTLTGIVKENDNGILKVSTVEDPNNPPPAAPDVAGLKTVINYGTPKKLFNGTVVGSLTVSDDASVSGFTSSDSNLVYTDNPFLQILEGSEPVINTFEIVIPFTKGTSSDDWLFALSSSTSGSGQGINNYFQVNGSNKLNFYSTYPSLNMVGTTTLTSNTKYWVKFAYDETEGYKILLSTNGSDYTVEASSSTTTELNVNFRYLIFGNNLTNSSTSYNWSGTIHFDGAYININGRQFWKGSKSDFGSVGVYYGYFRNTLSNPSDKYVVYDGGLLTEDNVFGGKATEMSVVLGRSASGGSWTSDTKGFITTQDEAVVGANKKLSTPIYLWHDLSRITPAKPETIEAVVDLVANTVSLPIAWKNIEGVLYEYPNGFPATQATELEVNVVEGSNNLYVTKTGDTCGMAISSSSPAGVDSSAVIGIVELDANGVITGYTLGE